ncbi:Putative zinc-binding metallo-peptidase [Caloramator quimbayensis]|uniref:Putative zinc-binding metallo-peptidase n=1 Tax=Caloramator quimbayensis TaxID=1147123 RepID=A0A1T4WKL7_9CLOT|nr:putative zinc-binding metallopeptidase [Caloramator quimbayensis]SKA77872.1 Putative zinc-binding metallo-peptidase [Caloramator quimbayensis]
MKNKSKIIILSTVIIFSVIIFLSYTLYANSKILKIPEKTVTLKMNDSYELPSSVDAVMVNGKWKSYEVEWENPKVDTKKAGTFEIYGKIKNSDKTVKAVINVVPKIVNVDDIVQVTLVGGKAELPTKVKAQLEDGTLKEVEVKFDCSPPETDKPDIYFYDNGFVRGYDKPVKLKIVVRESPDVEMKFITEKLDLDKVFSPHVIDSLNDLKYEPLDKKEVSRLKNIFNTELKKYPKEVLAANLNSISFFRSIKYEGISVGGTSDMRMNIYMCDDNYSTKDIKMIFHHELNHILYTNNMELFNEKEWKNANIEGFNYGDGGTEAIKDGNNSMNLSMELAKKGFVNQYSMSAIEEDIAEISNYLFMNDKSFWKLVDSSERLNKKVRILIDFYHKLNPVFTEKYFRNL